MVHNILSKARKPKYDGTESTSWQSVKKTLQAFIAAYNSNEGTDIDAGAPVNELPQAAKTWIAGNSLLGDPSAETVEDLIFFPVVNPTTGALNAGALRAVLSGRGASADIPDAAKESAQAQARSLLESEFDAEPARNARMILNSRTSGKYRRVKANGRDHLVTNMRPIVGDSVMNGILYPDAEVHRSFEQLNNLPAPAGHPEVEGRRVSALDPMAMNAHNVGGFIRNPTKTGRHVLTEFWLDEAVAEGSDAGREVKRRIENGETIPVSTGLGLRLVAGNGTAPDGKAYNAIGKDYQFDHVALLLTDTAAGSHVGTELVFNAEGDPVRVGNVTTTALHEMLETVLAKRIALISGGEKAAYVRDIDLDESYVIARVYDKETDAATLYRMRFEVTDDTVSLLGDPQEVTEQTSYVPVATEPPKQEDEPMGLTMEKVTEFLASQGFVPVTNTVKEAMDAFEAHKSAFDAWLKAEAERLDGKRAELVENSELTAEQAAELSEPTVDAMLKTAKRTTADNSLRPGGGAPSGSGGGGEIMSLDECRGILSGAKKAEG